LENQEELAESLQKERRVVREYLYEKQERLRAEYIIDKAKRSGENIVAALVSHMVGKNLIEELTGVLPEHEKKIRQDKSGELREWVLKNVGKVFGTTEISKALDCSYDTAIKCIKENPFYFVKVSRGKYEIHDGIAEREAAKKDK